ncbi:MAG: ABC transporter permease [Candidatus Acetothermia bacterium]
MNISGKDIALWFIQNFVWLLAAIFFAVFSVTLGRTFFNFNNLHFIFYVSSMVGMLVLAESVALISGNFDLSVAQNAGLTAMLTGVLIIRFNIPGLVAIFLPIIIGGFLGAFNGFFIGRRGLNPFLVTLSTYLMFDWLTHVVRQTSIFALPEIYMFPGQGKIGGIYAAIFVFLIAAILLFLFLKKATYGNYIYAVGGNPDAAEMVGVDSGNVVFWVFVLSGALSGIAGLLYTGYADAITSTLADGKMFMAFAGAIIGGISLNGGRGTATNAVGGIILIGIIEAGLTMMRISPQMQGFLKGVLVFVAILINQFRTRFRRKLLMPN